MEIFFSKENFSVDYKKLLYYNTSVSRIFQISGSCLFSLDCLMSQKKDPLKYLLDVKIYMIKNKYIMLKRCMLYRKIRVLVCFFSLSSEFLFIRDKIVADHFKDESTPFLNSNDRLKFDQDVAFNRVREK